MERRGKKEGWRCLFNDQFQLIGSSVTKTKMLSSSCFLESESNPSIDYTFTEFYTGLDDKMLTAVHAENVKLLVCVVFLFFISCCF